MKAKRNETAILIGWAGKIFPAMIELLGEKGIEAINMDGDMLNRLDESHAALFTNGRNIRYIVYSALLEKDIFPSKITALSVQDWKAWKHHVYNRLFNVNRFLVEKMLPKGEGHFLVVGAISGVIPSNGEELSGAASASAFMIMKSMAAELAAEGLTASAVALGVLEEGTGAVTLDNTEKTRSHIPSGKPLSAWDAAEGIVKQLTESPCQWNGNVIRMDSGFSCSYMREW